MICILNNKDFMKNFISFLVCGLLAFKSFGADYNTATDIPYTSNSDDYSTQRCKLDVYYSPEKQDCPVVVWFHGGGLTGGNKFIPEELKNDSLVVVAANYRLMPKATIDQCIDDAAQAVAWTFNNIKDYGGSPSKIFVTGHSAGGYLGSMIGLDKRWLEKYGIDADSIAALVPYSGQVLTHFAQRNLKGISSLDPLIDEYAPMNYMRADAPPYIIISADREQELFGRYEENAYMWRMLKLKGHPQVYLYELQGFNHNDMASPGHHILKKHIHEILKNR